MYAYISKNIENTLVVSDLNLTTILYKNGYFGRLKDNKLYLKFVEALYLLYKKKIEILFEHDNNSLSFKDFFLYCSLNESNFELKYIVYKDLKERGYYVRSNIEYFRLYPRSSSPSKTKSKYFIYIQSERIGLRLNILIQKLRSAENVHKEFILAIVDEESDITYYRIKNLKTCN